MYELKSNVKIHSFLKGLEKTINTQRGKFSLGKVEELLQRAYLTSK
jgi:hypothetical protein